MQRVTPKLLLVTLSLVLASPVMAIEPTLKTTEMGISDAEFRKSLSSMLDKVENSIHALREQISESQSAPFLADLYLQLAELLAQKSNTLYYIQMEKSGGSKEEGAFTPVVAAQKESISVYQKVLKEFPDIQKGAQIRYRLALALKSIDEIPAFMKMAKDVIHQYPGTEEAMRSELLIGQYFFERHDLSEASPYFSKVAESKYIYERNLARYRLGMMHLQNEKYQAALDRFEQVITDSELKEQDNPYSVSLQQKGLKSDLKREALVDSVRAYTQLHSKNGDPVAYYAKIAPSELHFQEVIEKLAVRYIYVKNYDQAVKLLRSLSERTSDPQRVVNIYREVLTMIPVKNRAEIPVSEMRYVLEQYHRWDSFFAMSPKTKGEAFAFFETQIRELATRNHALAKQEKNARLAKDHFDRARDYYLMYLADFSGSSESAKMAANLADVYFAQKDWIRSGDYYLRTFSGEFGAPDSKQKGALIENAVLCLQKESGDSYYETIRRRGLMVKALDGYIAYSDKNRRDPALALLRAKTRYEQGLFPQSLEELLSVAKRFPGSKQAVQAGEIVLDYFNVKNDYEGLAQWSAKLLDAKIANAGFNQKLSSFHFQSESKILHDQVKKTAGYDEFAQGQSYLKTALASSDSALAQVALKEALAKSREERDVATYLKTAAAIGLRESDADKRSEILQSVAQEDQKVGRYVESLAVLKQIYDDKNTSESRRVYAYEKAVDTAILMRDWKRMAQLSEGQLWSKVSGPTLSKLRQSWTEYLESPIAIPSEVSDHLLFLDPSDEGKLALYKAQGKLSASDRARVQKEVTANCSGSKGSRSAICRWQSLAGIDFEKDQYLNGLKTAALALDSVQNAAPTLSALLEKYQSMSGAGDSQLDLALQLRTAALYQGFADYLKRVGNANPDFKEVLTAKAQESEKATKTAIEHCRKLAGSKSTICKTDTVASVDEILGWHQLRPLANGMADPDGESLQALQKKVFAEKKSTESSLELAKTLLEQKDYSHAVALAAQGMSRDVGNAAEYEAVLGCGALELGYVHEASFHLRKAGSGVKDAEIAGMRQKCQEQAKNLDQVVL